MNIYTEIILDHYKNPRNFGKLSNADKRIEVANPLCGDRITMEIIFNKKYVSDIKFIGKGCAISQASASILTEYVKRKSKDQLQKLDKEFIIKSLGINLGPNRLKCAILPLEALHKLL